MRAFFMSYLRERSRRSDFRAVLSSGRDCQCAVHQPHPLSHTDHAQTALAPERGAGESFAVILNAQLQGFRASLQRHANLRRMSVLNGVTHTLLGNPV